MSTSYDVKAGIIGKVASECDVNTSTDGENEKSGFVWDSIDFDEPKESPRKANVWRYKKDSREQAGNLTKVHWSVNSVHASVDDGKKAAKDLCAECGYKQMVATACFAQRLSVQLGKVSICNEAERM
jgi:hypothetical protein